MCENCDSDIGYGKYDENLAICIEHFHVTSSPSKLQKKTKGSHHVGVQRDRSFYGDLHKSSDILIILLICVELDKIPLLRKVKQLFKPLTCGGF